MDRSTVFATIEGERAYQEKMNEESGDKNKILPIESELLLIDNYLQQAKNAYTQTRGDSQETPIREVRKIAAICVRCMEHHGAPPRVY
jgi:hypothetical protein